MAAPALESADPRPCSHPPLICPEVGGQVQVLSSPNGAVSRQASSTYRGPGPFPVTSLASATVVPSGPVSRRQGRLCLASQDAMQSSTGPYGSMPPRLGIRTRSWTSLTTASWSSRAACSGPGSPDIWPSSPLMLVVDIVDATEQR